MSNQVVFPAFGTERLLFRKLLHFSKTGSLASSRLIGILDSRLFAMFSAMSDLLVFPKSIPEEAYEQSRRSSPPVQKVALQSFVQHHAAG